MVPRLLSAVLAGVNMPDGVTMDKVKDLEGFQTRRVELGPGSHVVTWLYKSNPVGIVGIVVFPLAPDGRIGVAYIDNVYFLPADCTITPMSGPVAGPAASGLPTTTVRVPRPFIGQISPSCIP